MSQQGQGRQQVGFGRGLGGRTEFVGNTFPPASSPSATSPPAVQRKLVFRATVDMYFTINREANPDVSQKPLTLVSSMIEDIMTKAKMETKDGVIQVLGFNKTEIDQQA